MPKSNRISQFDIAQLAGVSQTTVSIVLNNTKAGVRVSPDTRARVLSAARELGYVANPAARKLAGGDNHLLGVFTYENVYPIRPQNFYYPFLIGIEEEAGKNGYDLVLFSSATRTTAHSSIYKDGINRIQLADGTLLLGYPHDRSEIDQLIESGYPFVFVGRRESEVGEISYAAGDYITAAREITTDLIKRGHRRIAFLTSNLVIESALDRKTGYHQAYDNMGLPRDPDLIHRYNLGELSAEYLVHCQQLGVTAFVLEHDQHFDQLVQLITTHNMTIPGDFSLAVLNPIDGCPEVPSVTQLIVPRREMGLEATRILIHILQHPDDPGPHRITIPCGIFLGESVGPPRDHND